MIITSAENLKEDSIKYTSDIIKKLANVLENMKKVHHKLKVKYEFVIKQRKLEVCCVNVCVNVCENVSFAALCDMRKYFSYL